MKNVTITLEDEVARWARIRAAERESSVSRMLGEMLRAEMHREARYREAEEEFFAIEPRPLRERGEKVPNRDELHDRARLR